MPDEVKSAAPTFCPILPPSPVFNKLDHRPPETRTPIGMQMQPCQGEACAMYQACQVMPATMKKVLAALAPVAPGTLS